MWIMSKPPRANDAGKPLENGSSGTSLDRRLQIQIGQGPKRRGDQSGVEAAASLLGWGTSSLCPARTPGKTWSTGFVSGRI